MSDKLKLEQFTAPPPGNMNTDKFTSKKNNNHAQQNM
jgi:hypothetical protein